MNKFEAERKQKLEADRANFTMQFKPIEISEIISNTEKREAENRAAAVAESANYGKADQ